MWSEVIYEPYIKFCQKRPEIRSENIDSMISSLAGIIYTDLSRSSNHFSSPLKFGIPFEELPDREKSFWNKFVKDIPDKLKVLNLCLHPFHKYCRTCLIPDKDIQKLATMDYYQFRQNGLFIRKADSDNSFPAQVSFEKLPHKRRTFYMELNYLIPLLLKKAGFELLYPEEFDIFSEKLSHKLAKAIHSQYLHLLRKQNFLGEKSQDLSAFLNTSGTGFSELQEFEELPEEIRFSNIDNACQIPAKLLSVGYMIRPVSPGRKSLALHLGSGEIEAMAVVEHLRWCWDKRLNGWIAGNRKDPVKKIHPDLKAYEDLPEQEKEKDRELVRLIPALLQDIGYEVFPVNPGHIKRLSYAIKPHSSIHKILEETREINDRIRNLVKLSHDVEEMVNVRNRKIEEAIKEIEGSYNYARHIQMTFLPDDLYIRECFQDSFVLYKPKDIVSGDFYFFSKQNNFIFFAAADCTGHGIPGALLSTLGYGILDQAVNEIKLTNPSEILNHLYSKIHRFLRSDESEGRLSADMDIALCILNLKSNELYYSGVNSPLYLISGGILTPYKARNSREMCDNAGKCRFDSEMIHLNMGDTIYIFSDGFYDQFGGLNHKRYQSSRFRNLLLSFQGIPLPEQSDMLNEEIEMWRDENNEDQTDDIMVIGVKI